MALSNDENELKLMILKRQKDRQNEMDSFFDHLASKYGKPEKSPKKPNSKRGKVKKGGN